MLRESGASANPGQSHGHWIARLRAMTRNDAMIARCVLPTMARPSRAMTPEIQADHERLYRPPAAALHMLLGITQWTFFSVSEIAPTRQSIATLARP
jgi:hypothetical protein